jgi:hypothetical protein
MKEIEIEMDHEERDDCYSTHIYRIDVANSLISQRRSYDDSRDSHDPPLAAQMSPFGRSYHRKACYQAECWEDGLKQKMERLAMGSKGDAELDALDLEQLIGMLRYPGFP